MSKFKIGDRVRISQGKDSPNSNRCGTITNGQGDGNGWHSVACDDDDRIWSVNESRLTLLDPDKAMPNAFVASDSQTAIAAECDAIKAMLLRLARGADVGEDVELDLIGYLVLLRIAKRKAGGA